MKDKSFDAILTVASMLATAWVLYLIGFVFVSGALTLLGILCGAVVLIDAARRRKS